MVYSTFMFISFFLSHPLVCQLSACNNCLVQISAVQNLPDLVLLNLENNSLMDVSGLEALSKLQWLSLGGNSLKVRSRLFCRTAGSYPPIHIIVVMTYVPIYIIHMWHIQGNHA